MATRGRWSLVVCIMLGIFHTGTTIKCYLCREGSSNNKTLIRLENAVDAAEAPCLNKNSVNCDQYAKKGPFEWSKPEIPNACARGTTIYYKPDSFELNAQACGFVDNPISPSSFGCDRTDSWSHDGTISQRATICKCNTDNCNAAEKITDTVVRRQSLVNLCVSPSHCPPRSLSLSKHCPNIFHLESSNSIFALTA